MIYETQCQLLNDKQLDKKIRRIETYAHTLASFVSNSINSSASIVAFCKDAPRRVEIFIK